MPSIITVESDSSYHSILRDSLSSDYEISFSRHVSDLGPSLHKKYFDLGIINLSANDSGGLEAFKAFSGHLSASPIIVTSEKDDADWIVSIIKAGAFDFIVKPYSGEKIRLAVDKALEKISLKDEIDYLRRQQDVVYDLGKVIARSPSMKSVMNLVEKYSLTDANLLITGETGTGKSFLAGSMHFNSPRKEKPFISINCANIPDTLLESELFGHERGAFTDAVKTRKGRIEQGRGGTVFLDEIGEMNQNLQSKFLKFVEEKAFERLGGNRTIHSDVRIIVATNQDLARMVKKGEFRSDLYFRLNVLAIHMPGLRERPECIEPLARHLLERTCRNSKKKVMDISPEALDLIKRYSWPGNIRELANVIERAVILETGSAISPRSIQLNMDVLDDDHGFSSTEQTTNLHQSEYNNIVAALEGNLWIQKKAAQELGISPRALNYKIRKYQITHWSWRKNKG